MTEIEDLGHIYYIDMKEFVKTINKTGKIDKDETQDSMLAKWLAVITEKDIKDKTIIKNICEIQEEINMAVSELVRLSEDKIIRHAYLKRQDEIMLHNRKDRRLAELEVEVVQKDITISARDAEIEELKRQLAEFLS